LLCETIIIMKLQITNYKKQSNKGFTLIELLLYVSISAALILAISIFFSLLLQSRIKNQTMSEVEQQGLKITQLITQTVRNAGIINSPSQGNVAATLSINTYTAINNPTIFDLASGIIRIKEGSSLAIALSNSHIIASDFLFENLSRTNTPGTIRFQFRLTYVNPENRNEYSFSKIFIGSATLRQP